MNNRVLLPFLIGIVIIAVVVAVVLAIILHRGGGSATATPTPTSSAAAITVHNDTSNPVQVQDCTAALNTCASNNTGTTRLAAGASGTEQGATGLRILNTQGHVVGCISLTGTQAGSTVNVSSASSCPS